MPHKAWMRQILSFLFQAILLRAWNLAALLPFTTLGTFFSPLIEQELYDLLDRYFIYILQYLIFKARSTFTAQHKPENTLKAIISFYI